jgi:hypothetical protein
MGLFYKPKTVGQVAKEFPEQYAFLKLFLFESWSNASGLSKDLDDMDDEELEMITYIGQVLQYVLAEDPADYGDASPEQVARIKRIREVLPEYSREAMQNNKDMRKIVVYMLRMKVYLHTMLDGAEWIDTPEGKRAWDILQIYGGEFLEEVTDKRFNKLVNQCARLHAISKAKAKNKR